ncbi:MAG: AAA family ATPase [Chloroflexi bacterium]|nr:AAA family ATPase [Chloroflexota bacterium]
MARLSLLIVSGDADAESIAARLRVDGFEVALAATAGEVASLLKFQPNLKLTILDTSLPPLEAFEIYRLLHHPRAIPTLMLVTREGASSLAGTDPHQATYDDYVLKPFKLEELVLRVKALLLRAGSDLPTGEEVHVAEGATAKRSGKRSGKVYCVFSPKGGTGKTTIAVNLAVAWAQDGAERVLLMDGDLVFGEVALQLHIDRARSIFDALPAVETVDTEVLEGLLYTHSSGVRVLLAPPRPVLAEQIPSALLTRVIALSRPMFDRVIVDTHSSYDERNLDILDQCDYILLVLTPEIGAVKNTVQFFAMADELGYKDKILLLLNRDRSESSLKLAELEKSLQMSMFATIVSAGQTVVEAANVGQPFVLTRRGSQVARDVSRLGTALKQLDERARVAEVAQGDREGFLRLPRLGRAK